MVIARDARTTDPLGATKAPEGGLAPAPAAYGEAELAGIRRRTTATLLAAQVFGGAGTVLGVTVATVLAADVLGATTWAGSANTALVLGTALASLPLSSAMDRLGRRRGLVAGYGVGAAGALGVVAAARWSSFLLLLVGLFLFGVANASNQLARFAAADVSPAARRGRAVSVVVWGGTVGSVAGPNLVEPAGSIGRGLGLPALAGSYVVGAAAFGVALAVLAARLRPDPLDVARALAPAGPAAGAGAAAAPKRSLSVVFRHPGARTALGALVASHAVMVMVMSITPLHLRHYDHSLSFVGLVISAHVLGMFGPSPLSGWAADRFGRLPVLLVGAGAQGAATLLAAAADPADGGALLVALLLLGLGWNASFVAGSALLTDALAPADRARAQGAADLWRGLAAAGASLVAGLVVGTAGYRSLGLAATAVSVLAGAAVYAKRGAVRAAAAAA